MKYLGIACGGDDNYAHGIAVAVYSALVNLSADVVPTVYILDGGLSADNSKRLEHVIKTVRPDSSVVWCRVSASNLARLPVTGHLSQGAYLRIFLGQFFQERTKVIVYFDCDVLVVRDISDLVDLDFGDYPVAAVRDFFSDDVSDLPEPLPEERCGSWTPTAKLFNSGVLIINAARYIALGVEEKTLSFGTRNCEHPAIKGDQDMLNPVLANGWLELPYTYNFCQGLLYIEEMRPKRERHRAFLRERSRIFAETKIHHFAAQPKPWHHWSTHPCTPLWVRYLMKSGWLDRRGRIQWMLHWLPRRASARLKMACGWLERHESTASRTDY